MARTALRRSCFESRRSTGVKSASPERMTNSSKWVSWWRASRMSITMWMSELVLRPLVSGGQSTTSKAAREKSGRKRPNCDGFR